METIIELRVIGQAPRLFEHVATAVGAAVLYCPIEGNAILYRGSEPIGDVYRIGHARYSWTLTADPDLWDAWGMLPAGHLHTDDSIRPD